jgi:hypothetical protein
LNFLKRRISYYTLDYNIKWWYKLLCQK